MIYQFTGASGGDDFGYEVAGGSNLNGDGVADFLIGARFANGGGLSESGSAYAYSDASGALLYQWNGAANRDNLGSAVAMAGDVDGDRHADLLVGAYQVYVAGIGDAGRTFLHSCADGSLLHSWDGEADGDFLGIALASGGDMNGDGGRELLIGADRADPNYAGAVYAYTYSP